MVEVRKNFCIATSNPLTITVLSSQEMALSFPILSIFNSSF